MISKGIHCWRNTPENLHLYLLSASFSLKQFSFTDDSLSWPNDSMNQTQLQGSCSETKAQVNPWNSFATFPAIWLSNKKEKIRCRMFLETKVLANQKEISLSHLKGNQGYLTFLSNLRQISSKIAWKQGYFHVLTRSTLSRLWLWLIS